MEKTIILARRPDLVLQLEKYGLLPKGKKGGFYEGSAKKWAKAKTAPYDTPVYQAMAERLPTGWEELTNGEMEELLQSLKAAIETKKQEKLDLRNIGSETMLKSLSQLTFLGLEVISALVVENGIGALPDKDENEKRQAMAFSFELMMHLFESCDVLTHIFRSIAKGTNTSSETQALITEALKTAAIVLSMAAASEGKEERFQNLLLTFGHKLSLKIAVIEAFTAKQLEEGAIKGEIAERAALYLAQAKLSLDARDPEGLFDAFTGALGMLGISTGDFFSDVGKIRNFAREIKQRVDCALNDTSGQVTTIAQSM